MLEKGELVVLKQEIVNTSIIFYPDTYVELLKVDVVPAVYAKNGNWEYYEPCDAIIRKEKYIEGKKVEERD